MKMDKGNKIILVLIIVLLVLIIGVTYAWLSVTLTTEKTNTIKVGQLSLALDEHEYIDISGADAIPLSEETALSMKNNVYNFDLSNNGTISSDYTIYLDIIDDDNPIPTSAIRYIITKNEVSNKSQLLSLAPKEIKDDANFGKIVLDSSYNKGSKPLTEGESNHYQLRLWIDEEATNEIANHVFTAKIRVVGVQTGVE